MSTFEIAINSSPGSNIAASKNQMLLLKNSFQALSTPH